MVQHFGEQRNLEFAQRDLVQIVGIAAVQVAEITAYRIRDVLAQRCAGTDAAGVVGAFGVQIGFP
jgi:hypothetical protein